MRHRFLMICGMRDRAALFIFLPTQRTEHVAFLLSAGPFQDFLHIHPPRGPAEQDLVGPETQVLMKLSEHVRAWTCTRQVETRAMCLLISGRVLSRRSSGAAVAAW